MNKFLIAAVLAALLISACGSSETPAEPAPADLISTYVAQTIAAVPSSTSSPTTKSTPVPATETAAPTPTPLPTGTDTPLPTATLTPTETVPPTAAPLPPGASCVPPNEWVQGTVTRVVDGDTVEVEIAGQIYRVRYIGIDAPEVNSGVEPFVTAAMEKNKELVEGKTIFLVKDVSETDRFDRLLRYVFAGDAFVNYELVRLGYASAAAYPPDTGCAEPFRQVEEQARTAGLGLWAVPPTQPQPTTAVQSPPQQANCDPSYPDVCIPPPPPDLDCGDISFRRFRVVGSDPHRFDGDHDGIGCES